MSNYPGINAALFNFCNRLDNGPTGPRSTNPPRSLEDLAWLRNVLESIESPDRVLKQHINVLRWVVGRPLLLSATLATHGDRSRLPESQRDQLAREEAAHRDKAYTYDDVMDAIEYLSDEMEDINMAKEAALMQLPPVLLEILLLSSIDPDAVATKAAPTLPPSTTQASSDVPPATTTALSVLQNRNSEETPAPGAPQPARGLAHASGRGGAHVTPLTTEALADVRARIPQLVGNAEVRSQCALILAHMCQQHPEVQDYFTVIRWADVVVPMLRAEVTAALRTPSTGSSTAALAALLHLCSCMCREYDEGAKEFIGVHGGLQLLQLIIAAAAAASARHDARTGQDGDEHSKIVLNVKVQCRTFFLVEYLASIGISSSAVIDGSCVLLGELVPGRHNELVRLLGDDEAVDRLHRQVAASILALHEKSPKTVGGLVSTREDTIKALKFYKVHKEDYPEDDPRRLLAKALGL